jgi:hypothetical protein
MKVCILFLMGMAALAAADKPANRKAAKPAASKTAKTAKAAAPLTIPAGAVEDARDPYTYHFSDPQGKKWIYRKTPFGVVRFEDKPDPKDADAAARQRRQEIDSTTAVEDGEYIRFTRPGPFGALKWQHKKTELDDTEKAIWEKAQAQRAAASGKGSQD